MSKIVTRLFILPLFVAALGLWSCESHAQKKTDKTHVEEKGHDKDGKKHGNERKGHDKDRESHRFKENSEKHDSKRGEHGANKESVRGEHKRDKGEGGKGEENGKELSLSEIYDEIKHGVRLILKYDKTTNSFKGVMTNTTNKPIERARVEVHLNNGTELGPTKPITLKAKAEEKIDLKATKKEFTGWSTHAEVGSNEHSHEKGEGHEGNTRGEHN